MSTLAELEGQIESLTPDDLAAFRDWFLHFDAKLWDQKIERDTKNGALMSLAEIALHDHALGRSTRL